MIKLFPEAGDIVIHAAVEVQDVRENLTEDTELINGTKLGQIWPQIVNSTHIAYGDPMREVRKSVFMPIDTKRFMGVRCRACSGMEKWGPNTNGDGFPAKELEKSHLSLIAKGFYIEHASFDPRNAIGIIAHAEWSPVDQFVTAIALVDKQQFPDEANMIRRGLAGKVAGVSIGCIAGEAQCSVCGNVARKKHEICACMDRGNPLCVKGRRLASGNVAYDVCRNLTFYELSYTKSPADRDARPHVVLGAAEGEKKEGEELPKTVTLPSREEVEKLVATEVGSVWKSILHKLVKGEIDRKLSEQLRSMQMEIRPLIREIVKGVQITK
jgi:hypothetical protein